MSRWVNLSGSRRYKRARLSIFAVLSALALIPISGCIQIWPFWTEPTGVGTYFLSCLPVDNSDIVVYPSPRFSPESSVEDDLGAPFTKDGLRLERNRITGVHIDFGSNKKKHPRCADGLFLLENTSSEPRRVFAYQGGGSKHDEIDPYSRMEHLGIERDQLQEVLYAKIKEGIDALNAYWEEVHRFYPEIALLIPPKSTIALPWR